MKRSKLAPGEMMRTAIVPVRLKGAQARQAFDACHASAQVWNALVDALHADWSAGLPDPDVKRLRAVLYTLEPQWLQRLHAHTRQAIVDDVLDAVATCHSNRASMAAHGPGLQTKMPWRHKNYRPLEFTAGYGWRAQRDGHVEGTEACFTGTLYLSLGRHGGRLRLPLPRVTDPETGKPVPCTQWRAMRLCWDIQARSWSLHIAVPTRKRFVPGPHLAAIDEGIIHPMTVCVETDEAYEVLVLNGRDARSTKDWRNKKVARISRLMARCEKDSRRWNRLNRLRKRVESEAAASLRNSDHHVSRKAADFMQAHGAGRIVAGDVRGIEQGTRQAQARRTPRGQRRRLSQWSRGRQEDYLKHKTGLPVEHMAEDYSSQTCPACLTRNRPSGRNYRCAGCSFTLPRDAVGALNIGQRAKHGAYTRIDGDKPIRLTYLQAVPRKRRACSTGTNRPRTAVHTAQAAAPVRVCRGDSCA